MGEVSETAASPTKHSEVTGGVLTGADPLHSTIALFLLQVVIIMATTKLLAFGLNYLKQPRVIAEILAGILLGPSAMGYIPGWISHVFPEQSLPFLTLVASIGLILYMFLVGLELSPTTLFKNARQTVVISVVGIVFPFLLGSGGSVILYQHRSSGHEVPFPSFLLFTGLSMSITAFPVLARILTDLNLVETEVGVMTIGAAALDDAVAWCLLILVISILHSSTLLNALYVFCLVAIYGALLLFIGRPLLTRYMDRAARAESETLQSSLLALTFMAIFLSAFFTDMAGVHTIFGAFLLGLAFPQRNPSTLRLAKTIEDFASIVFLPLYFAASGLRTQVSSLSSTTGFLLFLLVLGISTVGKFVGCALAARYGGEMPWRESLTVGALMNTRGLVELIVLNLGLDAKVIDVEQFTIFVLMALITTFATSPVVSWLYPPEKRVKFGCRRLRKRRPGKAAADSSTTLEPPVLRRTRTAVHPLAELAAKRAATAGWGKRGVAAEEEEEERGIEEKSPERAGGGCVGTMKLMLVAQRMADVPGLALLTDLLHPDLVSCVRFVESEATPLSILMSQGTLKMATSMDPTLQMMLTCGYLAGLPVDVHLKICKSEEFAKELCRRAVAQDSSMVLVPCRREHAPLGDYHTRFVKGVIQRCSKPLLLFWDYRLGESLFSLPGGRDHQKNVLLVFQGGRNDREALRLAHRFVQAQGVGLHVLVTQRAGLLPPEDQAELAHFERCCASTAEKQREQENGKRGGWVVVSRYDAADGNGNGNGQGPQDADTAAGGGGGGEGGGETGSVDDEDNDVTQRVLDVCKREAAHLIVLGATSEAAVAAGMDTPTAATAARATRSYSVPHGVEINFRKRLLSAKLGQALVDSEIHASLLVVLVPSLLPETRGLGRGRIIKQQGSDLRTLNLMDDEDEEYDEDDSDDEVGDLEEGSAWEEEEMEEDECGRWRKSEDWLGRKFECRIGSSRPCASPSLEMVKELQDEVTETSSGFGGTKK